MCPDHPQQSVQVLFSQLEWTAGSVPDRVLGTPVFLECNPHSSSAIIFGVQSTLQSRLIFGVRIDALQTALRNISRIGVQIGVLPLQIRTPIHISLRTPIQNTGLGVQCAECGVRNVECGMWSAECGVRNVECRGIIPH